MACGEIAIAAAVVTLPHPEGVLYTDHVTGVDR